MKKYSYKKNSSRPQVVATVALMALATLLASWGLYITVFRPSKAAASRMMSQVTKVTGAYVEQPITISGTIIAYQTKALAAKTSSTRATPPLTGYTMRIQKNDKTTVGVYPVNVETIMLRNGSTTDGIRCGASDSGTPENPRGPCAQVNPSIYAPAGEFVAKSIIIATPGTYEAILVYNGQDLMTIGPKTNSFTVKSGTAYGTLSIVPKVTGDNTTTYKFSGSAEFRNRANGPATSTPTNVTIILKSPTCGAQYAEVAVKKGLFSTTLALKSTCGTYTAVLLTEDQQIRDSQGKLIVMSIAPPGSGIVFTPTPTMAPTVCLPLNCTTPPAGCKYINATSCSCGDLVCTPITTTPTVTPQCTRAPLPAGCVYLTNDCTNPRYACPTPTR